MKEKRQRQLLSSHCRFAQSVDILFQKFYYQSTFLKEDFHMKTRLALLLVFALCLSLAACGNGNTLNETVHIMEDGGTTPSSHRTKAEIQSKNDLSILTEA